jgi:hypothetical protein
MAVTTRSAAWFLAFAVASAQAPPNPGFRLAFVQRIYIESLGEDLPSTLVRSQIAAAIFKRTGLEPVADRAAADAVLTGTAMVTSGHLHWAIASASANQTSATAQASAGGGTVRITELGLQLSDPYGRILWAFDGSGCLETTTLVLTGIPLHKPPTLCAAEQLAKAISRDAKAAHVRR